jgi:hypothetical protein
VHLDGTVEEPTPQSIDEARKEMIGLSQYVNIQKNHMGKYMVWFRALTWKDARNRREANNICRALDAFIDEGIDPSTSVGYEIMARRLAGIMLMNEGKVKNPSSVADQLEYRDEDAMIPHHILTAAVKTSAMYERITGSGEKSNKWNNNHKGNKAKGTGGVAKSKDTAGTKA